MKAFLFVHNYSPKKEENDFKAEKDQLIKDVAKTVTTPKNLHPQVCRYFIYFFKA